MLHWLLDGTIPVGDGALSVREVVGNGFGLASALLGMRRLVWAWPVGLVGNVLLFTVFVSGELSGAVAEPLWGQAGRQVLFAVASAYGWWRWQHTRGAADGGAVAPRWASGAERLGLLGVAAVGYVLAYEVLQHIGSYSPPTEAWILTGSVLATYGMARGFVEFWLIWVAVDVVGVTTLVNAGYYPTAGMYLFYGGFCVLGFFAWWRAERRTETADEAVTPHSEGALA